MKYIRCPKCGFNINQDLHGLRKLELETMLGDLLELNKFKKMRDWDKSHYYEGMNSGKKEVIVAMIQSVIKLRNINKKKNE